MRKKEIEKVEITGIQDFLKSYFNVYKAIRIGNKNNSSYSNSNPVSLERSKRTKYKAVIIPASVMY